jgi:CubicO group peptidase (beta-lactamase class C family)
MAVASQVDRVLASAAERGTVAGVVALAADARAVRYEGAFGKRALGGDAPMTLDTVFGIASMTKPVTSVAALQLVEQGRVSLDEPLGARLPELGAVQVLDGFGPDGQPRLRPPRRPVTLRHLLTHTGGFAY